MAPPQINNLMSHSAWIGKDPHQFADPFMSFSSMAMPTNIDEANRWVEFIIGASGVYRSAISRVIAYFITDIDITSKSDGDGKNRIGKEEKQQYVDFLEDKMDIKTLLQTIALDFMVYGNSFTSVLMPFRRYLACPKCGFESPLAKIANAPQYGYKFTNFEFTATCTHCKYSGVWQHIDRRSGSSGEVAVKRWSPHEMAICYDKFTGAKEFIWKIPEDYRAQIRRGELFQLERANWEVVETIKHNQHLWFDKDVVYHMRENPLAGIRSEGWGISRVLANFRQAWYVQLLHAYNEALALDYIIPFRVITPTSRKGSQQDAGMLNDPLLNMNMGDFRSRVLKMIADRRRDPAQWNVLPSPIEYQALGGDATQLAPSQLLELGMDTLLTSIGVPVEMYKGSMSIQAAPAALRLFEANWSHLVHAMNQVLSHIVQRVGEIFNWEPVTAKLVRVTHADDLNRQMAKLQLMMGGQISRTTGLSSVGLDFADEERTKLDEERTVAEETEKAQAEMDQQANIAAMSQGPPPAGPVTPPPMPGMPGQMPMMQGMPGAMPGGGAPAPPAPAGGDPAAAGGAPPAPGAPTGAPPDSAAQSFGAQQMPSPNQPTTVEEMQNQASTIASQVMGLPETQRKSYLIQLRKENPVMADLVQSQLDDMRYQARMQGGDMVMQQQQQATQQQPMAMPQQ